MSTVTMNEIRDSINSEKLELGWEYEETLSSPGNGVWIKNPNGILGSAVTLEISGGSGKVQATTSLMSKVDADLAVGVDWAQGVVTGTIQDYVIPVTAIRQVNVSGTTKITVRSA